MAQRGKDPPEGAFGLACPRSRPQSFGRLTAVFPRPLRLYLLAYIQLSNHMCDSQNEYGTGIAVQIG